MSEIVLAVCAVVTILVMVAGWVLSRIRAGDKDEINGLGKRIDSIDANIQIKLDKQDHHIALVRIDRDIDLLRAEQSNRLDRIDDKLDKIMDYFTNK